MFLVDSFLDNFLAWGLWAVSFKIKINFYVDFSTVNFSLLQLKTGTRFEVCFLHGYIFPNNGQCRVLSITILGGWCLVSQGLMLRRPLIIFLRCHHYNIFCYTNNLPCIILNDVLGSQMVLVMKLISLAFDVDKGVITQPNILEYFGYTLSVSSVVFGPFMTYTDYCQILVGKPLVRKWVEIRLVNLGEYSAYTVVNPMKVLSTSQVW